MPINTPVEQQIVSSTGKALAVHRGKAAMLVADLDKGAIVLMDGKTYGGIPAAREDVQIRAGSGAIMVNGKEWSTLTGTINIDIKPDGFIESAVSPSDKVLGVGDDGKIAAQLSVDYDVDTGLFSLKGKDGAVISSFNLVIPTGITPKSVALVQNPESQTPGLYLEFTFVDDDDVEIKLYANMDALKDVYTAGRGITISDDRVISVDEDAISGVIADDLIGEGGGLKVGDDSKLQVAVDPNGVIGINENGLHLQFDGGLQSTVMPDGEHVLELGSHASETPEYGLGDEIHYGHVKLSDEADATATEAAGIAATPAAVKTVDNAAVHKTGNETISGVKTFEDIPLIKQADGSTDQVATIGDAQMLVDGTIWGKRIETDLPEDTSQLTANMPVGAFLVTPGGSSGGSGCADLEPRVAALEEDMQAVTQVITVPPEEEGGEATTKAVVAAHAATTDIYGVATPGLYGHVRVITDTTASNFGPSDVFSAAATAFLVGNMGTPGEINWPDGQVPSVGIMLDSATFLVTSSGSFTLPAGKYSFEVVGGGGKGQDGYAPFPANTRSGAGGGSAQPVIEQVMLNAAATVAATIGASGGNSVVTVADKTITGYAGAEAAGGYATGYGTGHTSGNGGAGPSYTHPGGDGGPGAHGTSSCGEDAGTYDWGRCGAGGGAGSRLSRVITSVVAANGAASANPRGGSDNNYGRGGTGYGAGGGGGGAYWATACGAGGSHRAGSGGAGAPGCVLITARV